MPLSSSSIIWYCSVSWGSKQAHRATHWPRVHGLAASAGVWLKANESEISAAPWAKWLVKDFILYTFCCSVQLSPVEQTCHMSNLLALIQLHNRWMQASTHCYQQLVAKDNSPEAFLTMLQNALNCFYRVLTDGWYTDCMFVISAEVVKYMPLNLPKLCWVWCTHLFCEIL